ncbi:hypothetical protein NM688_g7951 [Phlebia brevispora]|uniref:Uncharacterized protein n=1 Tax=Phlebia brevispora TaxID=194682 RepID=A0ACC1RZR7_9APHY|nr:hypothetical protein NM688_g7951 [Phlebia brevispora]
MDFPAKDSYVRLDTYKDIPNGWTSYMHPRGWAYFRNHEYHVITDEDIRIPLVCETLSNFCVQHPFGDLSDGFEVHIIGHTVQNSVCVLVDHNECLAGFDLIEKNSKESISQWSVGKLISQRRRYWTYVQNHPVHLALPAYAFAEAKDALQALLVDHMLSGSRSTAPFSKQECRELLDTLSNFIEHGGSSLPSCTTFVAWILRIIYTMRGENKYWQYNRRSFEEATAPRPNPKPHHILSMKYRLLLSIIVNVLCFGIPYTYLSHTEKASEFHGRLEGLQAAWQDYTTQLAHEYANFVIAGTVLLSVTVGFLATPDITYPAKLLCIVAIFASLGSMTTAILFVWRHDRQISSSHTVTYPIAYFFPDLHTLSRQRAYIHNVRNGRLGLTGHAILLSLPPVLLVWALLMFTAAIVVYSVQSLLGAVGLAIIFAALALVLFVVVSGVYTFSRVWRWRRAKSIN